MTFPDSLSSLHPIDAVAIAFLAYHGLMGVVRGFAFQCVRLATWITAVALSRRFSGEVAVALKEIRPSLSDGTARAVGFGAIVLATLIVGLLVVKLTKRLIESWKLATADRVLGFVLGTTKAIAIILILMVLITNLAPGVSETLANTKTAQLSSKLLAALESVLPEKVVEDYKSWLDTNRDAKPDLPFELPIPGAAADSSTDGK